MKRHNKSSNSEPSQRQLRVGEQLRHIMSETLQRGHFSDKLLLDKSHTLIISQVCPSPDLKYARAYIMSINGQSLEELLTALNSQSHIFQKDIAKSSNLKFTPKVKFIIDNSFDKAQHIEELLRSINTPNKDENVSYEGKSYLNK